MGGLSNTMKKRYQRNLGTLGEEGQKKLLGAHVVIIGAGGLGGSVFENLVRAGIGTITIVDPEVFEPTNLNRQLLSSENNIGRKKVEIAKEHASKINSDINVIAVDDRVTSENAESLLKNSDIVCDCIDSIPDRFIIQNAAGRLEIPMVHAAVAGTTGQLMTILPGDIGLKAIYGDEAFVPIKGEEEELGTPSSTVSAIAALQAHETIGIVTGNQTPLRNELLRVNLESWNVTRFKLAP